MLEFREGDIIILNIRNIKTTRPNKSLDIMDVYINIRLSIYYRL